MATRTRKKTSVAKAETIASSNLRCNICREVRPITSLAFRSHITQKYHFDSVTCEKVLILVYCADKTACSEDAKKER